ncbi:hypothetical protein CNECB9_180020 [Cupriavidus necator]|uniref:Uncharacterized protein n=1 Tax=Cupriavidus necator TaxID=106590 RepID=A0A1K0IBG0_CUPNE|nr:hypothetical protein CNECB9_180020 [Cupriavidus necator]
MLALIFGCGLARGFQCRQGPQWRSRAALYNRAANNNLKPAGRHLCADPGMLAYSHWNSYEEDRCITPDFVRGAVCGVRQERSGPCCRRRHGHQDHCRPGRQLPAHGFSR